MVAKHKKETKIPRSRIWKVGLFLAFRQVRHASKWTTSLIILVMTLTFLNLVVINGVLVGLIESSVQAAKDRYSGEVIVSTLRQKTNIENSQDIINVLENIPSVEHTIGRYMAGGKINADYRRVLRDEETPNAASMNITGIDPIKENSITGLSEFVIAGSYLDDSDEEGILVGGFLINEYTPVDSPGFQQLRGVKPGDRVKVTVGNVSKEMIIRGILKSKVDEIDARVFMLGRVARQFIARSDVNYNEIAVKLKAGATIDDAAYVKSILVNNGFEDNAKIQTWEEAQPKFLKDISATFGLLGNLIGSIGLAVASITIFIVIFVNAITRRKFIGILKGIGISAKAIEVSYIIQSIFYALIGSLVGLAILYGFLVPFIDAHPINFPFSDGILYAPLPGTLIRVVALLVTTIIAGFIPARMIVKRNTLDAILGR